MFQGLVPRVRCYEGRKSEGAAAASGEDHMPAIVRVRANASARSSMVGPPGADGNRSLHCPHWRATDSDLPARWLSAARRPGAPSCGAVSSGVRGGASGPTGARRLGTSPPEEPAPRMRWTALPRPLLQSSRRSVCCRAGLRRVSRNSALSQVTRGQRLIDSFINLRAALIGHVFVLYRACHFPRRTSDSPVRRRLESAA